MTDTGKPLDAAREEIAGSAAALRLIGALARVPDGQVSTEYLPGATSIVRREPVGVIGLITPWNYPLLMAMAKLAPALATGNTVVLKPSELTPLSSLRLAELAADVLPAGVLNVICGVGETVGAALTAHPGIDLVSMTGSVATGRRVAAAAAPTLKRLCLELGGKAPVLVLDDGDVDRVVAGIRSAGYSNAGQDCGAACRVLAAPALYDRLVEDVVAAVESIRTGAPDDAGSEMGPLISAEQQARVLGFVDRADARGARIETGGERLDRAGFFVAPTVLTGRYGMQEYTRLKHVLVTAS